MQSEKRIAYIIRPDENGNPVIVGTREFDPATHTHSSARMPYNAGEETQDDITDPPTEGDCA